MKNLFVIATATILAFAPATMRADDFDLDSQRGEVQEFNSVPGHKIDHHGLVINPTPQSIERAASGVLNVTAGFRVKDARKAFASDLGFLTQSAKGVPLTITFGAKEARKAGVKEITGAYALDITKKGVSIIGYDERGAFYGLQTLRQILTSQMAAEEGGLPLLTVRDFPSMKYRGVVEGFYGTPWSHDVRLSLLDFYGQNKLSDYLYGPKDDPYHSTPNWRLPYPDDQAAKIRELVERAKANRVNFIWAIHPGQDIQWNEEDYRNLLNKFNLMYDLGVRSFAIFFDDIDGIGTDPHRQVELLNRLTTDFVDAKGDVTNLIVCPTDYSQLWAKPGPEGPLAVYGRELNPKVEVFWTGAVVCSDLTPETLEFINSRIKRPALYWWNYPVTDYVRNILLQGPVYGLDTTLTADQVAGIESNPMEHGEASKLALYGVADYAWNTPVYNPIDNWERALVFMMPEASDAYRTFAINSCDTETGYRRDEAWETVTFPYNNYTQAQYDSLRIDLLKAASAEATILAACDNELLLKEIKPWLAQLTKVAKRGLTTLDLIKVYETGSNDLFWNQYVAALMSPEDQAEYQAHKVGTMKLQPFYEESMADMVSDFYERLTGSKPTLPVAIGSYPNLRTTQGNLMLDGDTTTYYTSANSQSSGDWIGVDLRAVIPVDEVLVRQGRNSVDDVDYFERVRLEYSTDGADWKALTPDLDSTYVISWKGQPVQARYLRLKRLDSPKTNWASVRTFQVNTPSQERYGLNIVAEGTDLNAMLSAFDGDPTSSAALSGTVEFNRAASAKTLTLLLGGSAPDVTVTQLDAAGRQVMTTRVRSLFSTIKLAGATTRILISGNANITEIIQQ